MFKQVLGKVLDKGILANGEDKFYCINNWQKLIMGSPCLSMVNWTAEKITLFSSSSADNPRNLFCPFKGTFFQPKRYFNHSAQSDAQLNRDFLVQLWISNRKIEKSRKNKGKVIKYNKPGRSIFDPQLFGRSFSGAMITEEKPFVQAKSILQQPPVSQTTSGFLEPSSLEEAQVAPLLARSNLLITRDIEWANLVLGFEQENRYAIVDVCYPQSPVGYIREQSNVIARQLLRLRRPFVAHITDGVGNELFRVRRPFWWITSSIYAEINGKEVGVVHRRWHLWRRVYDLYLGNKQFAVVENPGFWNWTFTLKDINGEVVAEIDRDWRGFGFEVVSFPFSDLY